jgi:hypothetical protein
VLTQRFQQRPGFLKIGSVKAFGKPAVYFSEPLTGFTPFALLLPQATQARSCP